MALPDLAGASAWGLPLASRGVKETSNLFFRCSVWRVSINESR
ncbi:MAG: hypothetical protein AVDCRST_MAG43-545 [uncultured Thermomicrobiales bacterium]|uniref:Uncharacterized protein n=1 Tax=uncultured Thermomicrobiales bacterium TaxID=1645740 RepID=A0A6J4UDI0_9BACT|nr:MAG: hypothetical protein AVDCRST_MAG43-545 [uncultured Thermomicrobiales bacterium]